MLCERVVHKALVGETGALAQEAIAVVGAERRLSLSTQTAFAVVVAAAQDKGHCQDHEAGDQTGAGRFPCFHGLSPRWSPMDRPCRHMGTGDTVATTGTIRGRISVLVSLATISSFRQEHPTSLSAKFPPAD